MSVGDWEAQNRVLHAFGGGLARSLFEGWMGRSLPSNVFRDRHSLVVPLEGLRDDVTEKINTCRAIASTSAVRLHSLVGTVDSNDASTKTGSTERAVLFAQHILEFIKNIAVIIQIDRYEAVGDIFSRICRRGVADTYDDVFRVIIVLQK